LYDRLHLTIGSTVSLSAPVTERVTIRGVVSTGGLFQGDFGIGGTIYQPLDGLLAADPAESGGGPNRILADKVFIRTAGDAQTPGAVQALRKVLGPYYKFTTAADVSKTIATNTTNLQRLLLAAGLLALLIGGIGIVNTMLVSVGRRTKEIAVLKALGLKGYEVVPLFLTEALLLGVAGSVIGIVAGIGLSLLVTSLAVQLGAQVTWSLRASPLVVGLALGVIATAIFGFLPVLRAGRTRPIGVLRDEDAPLPRIGWLVTSIVTVLLTGAMGITAGVVLRNVRLGIGLAYGVVLIFLLFSGIFLLIVTLSSRGPSFGMVTLRLALRNLSRQKRRAASTLVALFIGMLAVGTVVVLAQNVRAELHKLFQRDFGFNVVAISRTLSQEQQALALIHRLPGLQRVERGLLVAGLQIETIDGKPAGQIVDSGRKLDRDTLFALRSIDGRDLRLARLNVKILAGGRMLTGADEGTGNAILPQQVAQPLHLHVGSTLSYTLLFGTAPFTLHVVGIIDPTSITPTFGGGTIASASFLRRYVAFSPLTNSMLLLQVASSQTVADASTINRELPQVYALDFNSLIPLIDRILDRATVFPLVLAALSLFSGAVIIANTVALAVLERRREIGVMKALGARGGTVLRLLLLESGIVGLMGGAMGMGMAMIATLVLDNVVLSIPTQFDPLVIGGLIAISVLVALAASIISALPASREKPLIVLRYE
ncbi:MAG TPA: FtsX-like permease family protein, partial [Chloroflexota bacterium]|nr:FtsX-like permease family protein [Chloroflexota bacterium]